MGKDPRKYLQKWEGKKVQNVDNMKPVTSVGDWSAIPWGVLGGQWRMCSSVILLEGQFLAAVGSGMGALNTPCAWASAPPVARELQARGGLSGGVCGNGVQ